MRISSIQRHRQAGGITIIVALILVAMATVTAVGLSRTALRESLITGNESTGRKAFEMADSGLDYTITWAGNPYGTPNATATTINAISGRPAGRSTFANCTSFTQSTSSRPSRSKNFQPSARASPKPASLVALPPMPRITFFAPRFAAVKSVAPRPNESSPNG